MDTPAPEVAWMCSGQPLSDVGPLPEAGKYSSRQTCRLVSKKSSLPGRTGQVPRKNLSIAWNSRALRAPV